MNEVLALFLPSSLGTIIYLRNTNKSVEKIGFYVYLLNVLLTNMIDYIFLYYVKGIKTFNFSNLFTLKYSLLSLVVSLILSIIFIVITKYIKLEVIVEEVKDEREVKEDKIKKIGKEESKKQKKKYKNNK